MSTRLREFFDKMELTTIFHQEPPLKEGGKGWFRLKILQCMQFAQEPLSSRVEAILADRKRITANYARKTKPGSSAATAENICMVTVQN